MLPGRQFVKKEKKEELPKRKKENIFGFYKNFVKDKNIHSDFIIKSDFSPFMMSNMLSYDFTNIFLAEAIARSVFTIPNKAAYLFYFYGINKKSKVPFLKMKKEKDEELEELLEVAKIYLPNLSRVKLVEMFPIFRDFLIEKKEELTEGGKRK